MNFINLILHENYREDKTPEENKSPQEMPRYMKPTEAYSRRASTTRPKSPEHWADDPELRKKYPHWYKDQDNNNESDNRRSPDTGCPKKSYLLAHFCISELGRGKK